MSDRAGRVETIVILGALSAFAPLSIDMYLPAMPSMEVALDATALQVQTTLAAFFLGFAGGQALYGPFADRYGRKPPLYVGLALFTISSALCAFVPSVAAMIGLRFLEALGACAGSVVSRAMVRDLFPAREGGRIFSRLMLVNGVAPIVAPLIGSYVMLWFGWRTIFWVLAAAGGASLIAAIFRLPAGHRGDTSHSLAIVEILKGYGRLMVDREYRGAVLAGAFSMSGMFTYIAGSPFVFIDHFAIPPQHFGWLFATNAFGIVVASQINGRLISRHGPARLMWTAILVQIAAAVPLLASALTAIGGMWGIAVPLFVFVSCIGVVLPNSAALAMAHHARVAGAASALLGTMQFTFGMIAALLVGALHAVVPLPMVAIMAACGLCAVLTFLPLARRESA